MSEVVEESAELKSLKEHHSQIKMWMTKVQLKIYELETSYLEETSMGNLVKGWETDGRPPLKSRGQFDEKERIFSFSSHLANEVKAAEILTARQGTLGLGNKHKKNKKRKLDVADDYVPGDY